MKRIQRIVTLLFLLQTSGTAKTVQVKAPRFVRPLVERWAAEYSKEHADFGVRFVRGEEESHLKLVLSEEDGIVSFGRYAIVPFTARGSKAASILADKGLNNKRIKNVFFENDTDRKGTEEKSEDKLHIYTGCSSLTTSRPYATSYGYAPADYRGKRISGDDQILTQVISQDPLGLSIGTLSNLFDIETGEADKRVQIATLDTDKKSMLQAANTLAEAIETIENHSIEGVGIEKVGFSYDENDTQLSRFVLWILTNGQQYLHEYGLLTLSQKELTVQQSKIRVQDIAQK